MIDIETKNTDLNIKEEWDSSDLGDLQKTFKPRKKISLVVKFFIGSLILFLIAAGAVLYSFLNKGSSFSQDKILIYQTGPASITSGSLGEATISVTNNNNTPINEAYILVSYDSGESLNGDKNLINKRIEIGDVLANSVNNQKLEFTIFGAEGSSKEIEATLYYRLPDSKAEFEKESNKISILLKSSPVTINATSLKEIHNNYYATFNISVRNNTDNEIKNLIVAARNPNTFLFSTSSEPVYSNNPSWKIDRLLPGATKEIKMTGQINGNLGDEPNFTFYAGIRNEDLSINTDIATTGALSNFDNYNLNIDNIYSKVEKKILISGQYLDIFLEETYLNETTVYPGQFLTLELVYKNRTAFPLDNVHIYAAITGDSFDAENFQVTDAYYSLEDRRVIWNKDTNNFLSRIPAYGEGVLRINLRVRSDAAIGSNFTMTVSGTGDRNSEDNVSNAQDISFAKTWTVVEP